MNHLYKYSFFMLVIFALGCSEGKKSETPRNSQDSAAAQKAETCTKRKTLDGFKRIYGSIDYFDIDKNKELSYCDTLESNDSEIFLAIYTHPLCEGCINTVRAIEKLRAENPGKISLAVLIPLNPNNPDKQVTDIRNKYRPESSRAILGWDYNGSGLKEYTSTVIYPVVVGMDRYQNGFVAANATAIADGNEANINRFVISPATELMKAQSQYGAE